MTDAARIAALEEKVAKLEAAAVLFEENRQAWEKFCTDTNRMNKEFLEKWQRDDEEHKKREQERNKKHSKSLWEQLSPDERPPLDVTTELLRFLNEDRFLRKDIERGFAELKRGLADLTAEIRKQRQPV
jgi:hypothetical protein